jgi:hypothetical protein
MKTSVWFKTFSIAFFALFAIATINAQNTTPASKPSRTQAEPAPKGSTEAGYEELELNTEQRNKFKAIDEDYKKKKSAARTKGGNAAELTKLREEREAARKAVLTEKQAKKYDEIVARNKAKREEMSAKRREMDAEKAVNKQEKAIQKEEKTAEKAAKKEEKTEAKAEKKADKSTVKPKSAKESKKVKSLEEKSGN